MSEQDAKSEKNLTIAIQSRAHYMIAEACDFATSRGQDLDQQLITALVPATFREMIRYHVYMKIAESYVDSTEARVGQIAKEVFWHDVAERLDANESAEDEEGEG